MRSRQPELFAPPPAAAPAPALYAEVAVPLPVRGAFTYGVEAHLMATIKPGVRVAVPFGARQLVGFVVALHTSLPEGVDPERLRNVRAVLDVEPVFPADLMRFLREAADYYIYPLGDVLRTAAPAVDRRARDQLDEAPGEKGSLRARWARVREETFVRLSSVPVSERPTLRGGRQTQLLSILEARGEVSLSELRAQMKNPSAVLRSLKGHRVIEVETREVPDDPFFGDPVERDAPPDLVPAQKLAVDTINHAIESRDRVTFLLHGVTGSGKTEVYLRAVETAHRAGKGALILLPEIALTPQLVGRYRARFGDNLAVIHSGLKESDRYAMWRKLRAGECRVAIGARSAIFAPVHDLGLIIVDEEHDGSFKQDESFRYHGRDMAVLRAYRAGIVCVLGSATPSIETYHAALDGKFHLLRLPERATNASLPAIEFVDLKKMGRTGPTGQEGLSLPLLRALDETLSRGEQAIIFLNRRGFAPSLHCAQCDGMIECPSCSVALVLHRRAGMLKCHYCDFTAAFENRCVVCKSEDIELIGVGTEKIEASLTEAFPAARIGRLDRDVASGSGAEVVLDKLRRGDLDVLVGTQMVTKGHDIARVTLVGVIAADASLCFPDFRAAERTFQLLAQVAGRAGRQDLPGRVIIQTWQPEHFALRRAKTHDYVGFFHDELAGRRELGYPPFGRVAALRFDGTDEAKVRAFAALAAGWISASPEVLEGPVRVLGPAPSPLERLRGRFRMQMLLRAPERPPLRKVLVRAYDRLEREAPSSVRWSLDVDPVQML